MSRPPAGAGFLPNCRPRGRRRPIPRPPAHHPLPVALVALDLRPDPIRPDLRDRHRDANAAAAREVDLRMFLPARRREARHAADARQIDRRRTRLIVARSRRNAS